MRQIFVVLIVLASFFSSVAMSASSSSCGDYAKGVCTYSSTPAVQYALNYAKTSTAFPEYQSYGGNCTNFVSQAVLAGLVDNSDKNYVYNKRGYYMADRDKGCDYCWYYNTPSSRGYAWAGAHELYTYAKSNSNSYWGMHFDFITKDSSTQYLNTSKVEEGDVIFADWSGNGHIDHSMIVTDKLYNSYSGIKVSYQNSDGHSSQKNVTLQSINQTYTVFHVYRPTFYRN
ncbi:hypothetical protein A9Q91_04280 [Candidatus Gracilibacteria bacterium 28_42_T64]|nr:hypothetical protein A9Q91_04280 [Candidatus Gracilibacteria bacterium 28_42_T64]